MRRIALIALLLGSLVVFASASGGGGSAYRFTAVFDSAQGMVPGQLVKIAGARVGEVEDVELIPGDSYRARMVLEIGEEHGPFYADASCRLLPEGLISEKFVDCDPGTPGEPKLAAGSNGLPELTDTATPLALQDVLNIFAAPTDQRLRILLNELGIATAGRAEDINELLRRSNPALTQANEALAILAEQRGRIADSVEQTDRVLAELARDSDSVASFVDSSAAAARAAGSRPGELAAGIRELPPLLDAADDGLGSLNRALTAGTPLLDDLRDAGPALTTFMGRLTAFSRSGLPAVEAVTRAARTGREAIPPVEEAVANFRDLGEAAPAVVSDLADFMVSFRDTGGVDGLLRTAYGLAVGAAARDNQSHYYGAVINLFPICILVPPEVVAIPGCDHTYDSPENGRIPINDPQNKAAQERAFRRWLRIGGPEEVPRWLRGSVPALIDNVARSLGINADAVLERAAESPDRRDRPERSHGLDRAPASAPQTGADGRNAGAAPQPAAPGQATADPTDPAPDARPGELDHAVEDLLDFLLG